VGGDIDDDVADAQIAARRLGGGRSRVRIRATSSFGLNGLTM
jgi:hypothetical protein